MVSAQAGNDCGTKNKTAAKTRINGKNRHFGKPRALSSDFFRSL
jgi:hypothetical protein